MDSVHREHAIPRGIFHDRLREWLTCAEPGETVGASEGYGGKAWVWVKHLGNRYYLNADTVAEAVAEYLRLHSEDGEDIRWSVVENAKGNRNKVAFGVDQEVIPGFYLYRA